MNRVTGMHTSPVGRRKAPGYPVLETYKFLPYLDPPTLSTSDAVRCCTQLALENSPILKVKAVEVDIDNNCTPLLPLFELSLGDLPLVTADLMLLSAQELELGKIHVEDGKLSTQSNCTFVIASNCSQRTEFVTGALESLRDPGGYIVSRESIDFNVSQIKSFVSQGLQVVSIIPTESEKIVLLQRAAKKKPVGSETVIDISHDPYADDNYGWVEGLKAALKDSSSVIVLSQNNLYSGVIGLVNCIRKEPDGNKVVCVFVDDKSAPPFNPEVPLYKEQLSLGLAINVYRKVSVEITFRKSSAH